MGAVLRTAIVTAVWLLVQGVVGLPGLKGRRPYRAWILVVHIIVSLFIIAGWVFTLSGLSRVPGNHLGSWIAEIVMGLALVALLIGGSILTAGRKVPAPTGLVLAHHIGAGVALLGSLTGIVTLWSGA